MNSIIPHKPEYLSTTPPWRSTGLPRLGLVARVLLLTIVFVLVAEITIYIPSIANFRNNWLQNRLSGAYTAALVMDAAPAGIASESIQQAVLDNVGVRQIVLKRHNNLRVLASSNIPPIIDESEDLRNFSSMQSMGAAFRSLTSAEGRVLNIRDAAPDGAEYVEITINEAPLKMAMHAYSINILLLSLIISLILAFFAIAALHILVLAPVRRLTDNVIAFAASPEDSSRLIKPSGALHEIGLAEEALMAMESALARELTEKKHLAALGLAVAKVNHDLRNMLASAQLISDRMASVSDPLVKRLAPKLVATLDRAIRFCQATLVYGRLIDEAPKKSRVALWSLADEAAETAVLSARNPVRILNATPRDFFVHADREQLFRILHNLSRNAVEALDGVKQPHTNPAIRITAETSGPNATIIFADNGPGMPAKARDKLFSPFHGSTRPGGTGLGLAIAADLVRAHGGAISLRDSVDKEWPGAVFEIRLPIAS